ncbi:MAG: VTT domain-containing protein [Bacteroidota bacterium]
MPGKKAISTFFKKHWPLLLSITILLLLVGGYFIFPFYKQGIDHAFDVITSKDERRIKEWVNQFGFGGPLVLIGLMILQMFLLVIPNILVMIIAIIMYGPFWGAVISILGVFASSTFGFFIGKKAGPYTIKRLVSEKLLFKLTVFVEEYGAGAIAITRLASISNDSLSIIAGLLKMSYKKYILATLSGITPLVILLAIYGNNGKIERALIWIAAASMIILITYIVLDKRRKKRKQLAAETIAKNIKSKPGNVA